MKHDDYFKIKHENYRSSQIFKPSYLTERILMYNPNHRKVRISIIEFLEKRKIHISYLQAIKIYKILIALGSK